ncbi:hypothetical protein [Protofrankia coriariae]|uniref:hypothetical protein n=1 Tax=Protofrankia coriariae TaxID=1562887 RepID=UPI00069A3FF0|nr:hypothetical protein [Protofrankia coriariae]
MLTAPAGAEQARQALGELGGGGWSLLWAAARQGGRPVLVDCGRLDPASPAAPALRAADVLLLVVRARDDELAHLATRMRVIQGWRLPAWYLVVAGQPGRDDRYRMRDLAGVLGARVLGPIPHDPAAAAVLAGQRRARGGISRSRLGRAAAELAGYLTGHLDVPDQTTPDQHVPVRPGRDEPAALPAVSTGWVPADTVYAPREKEAR